LNKAQGRGEKVHQTLGGQRKTQLPVLEKWRKINTLMMLLCGEEKGGREIGGWGVQKERKEEKNKEYEKK